MSIFIHVSLIQTNQKFDMRDSEEGEIWGFRRS